MFCWLQQVGTVWAGERQGSHALFFEPGCFAEWVCQDGCDCRAFCWDIDLGSCAAAPAVSLGDSKTASRRPGTQCDSGSPCRTVGCHSRLMPAGREPLCWHLSAADIHLLPNSCSVLCTGHCHPSAPTSHVARPSRTRPLAFATPIYLVRSELVLSLSRSHCGLHNSGIPDALWHALVHALCQRAHRECGMGHGAGWRPRCVCGSLAAVMAWQLGLVGQRQDATDNAAAGSTAAGAASNVWVVTHTTCMLTAGTGSLLLGGCSATLWVGGGGSSNGAPLP